MIFFLVVIILNFIFYLLSDKIAKVLKLYDNPDKIRKIHTNKTSLLGGLIFLINIFGYLIYEVIVNKSVIFETFAFQKNL